MSTTDTRQRIMSTAREMVQAHGYNNLSFRDLATAVGVKSSSVHYHFPTKGGLASAVARFYTDEGIASLDHLLASSSDPELCLRAYIDVFRKALVAGNKMCLCGILAAEHDDLPGEVRVEVERFTALNVRWLGDLLEVAMPGLTAHEVQQRALAIFASIEGAQLVARGRGDVTVFDAILDAYRVTQLLPDLALGRGVQAVRQEATLQASA